jgi:hypothetical protein
MSLKDSLVAIERRLWKNDAALYRDNLHDDALLLFPETGPISRDTAVDAMRQGLPQAGTGPRSSSRTRALSS